MVTQTVVSIEHWKLQNCQC